MPTITKQAKVLADHEIKKVRQFIAANSVAPERDDLIFLLSFHAGMRASEISKIDLDAMTDASGEVTNRIIIDNQVAKNGRGREMPMTPLLQDAVIRFKRRYPDATFVAMGTYKHGRRMSPNTLAVYMREVLQRVGLPGASSHSGRRTFITNLARRANLHGASLRDVQLMAGHARLDTTERYVDVNPAVHGLLATLAG